MTQKRFDRLTRSARAEDGMALLIAVVVLLLMSALGLAALQHAGRRGARTPRSTPPTRASR